VKQNECMCHQHEWLLRARCAEIMHFFLMHLIRLKVGILLSWWMPRVRRKKQLGASVQTHMHTHTTQHTHTQKTHTHHCLLLRFLSSLKRMPLIPLLNALVPQCLLLKLLLHPLRLTHLLPAPASTVNTRDKTQLGATAPFILKSMLFCTSSLHQRAH